MDASTFPVVSADLLVDLERRFPERSAVPGQSTDELMFAGGQRSVVRMLREVFDQQNESILKPDVQSEDA